MYQPDPNRYESTRYRRAGESGLVLPEVSLGLWQNFGRDSDPDVRRDILLTAFDRGVLHFDLANNYGPAPGDAELNFGKVLARDLKPYRDELIISTKAGWHMWKGPYGTGGSKKYLVASLDQSLRRMGLEYVDIFYHHRPTPEVAIAETAHALDLIVRQGKTLYIGISSYDAAQTEAMSRELARLGTPFVIHQPRYNLLDRRVEEGLSDVLEQEKLGCICFSPLEQGLLTDRYLDGIPSDSRAARDVYFRDRVVLPNLNRVRALGEIARQRGQTLAQMSLSWLLAKPFVTSVLIGASTRAQLEDNLGAVGASAFNKEELEKIDAICKK